LDIMYHLSSCLFCLGKFLVRKGGMKVASVRKGTDAKNYFMGEFSALFFACRYFL